MATAVKERPILFSGPMVRALLDGRKTQTRRIVKPQPPEGWQPIAAERYRPAIEDKYGMMTDGPEIFGAYNEDWGVACPHGGPGDRLWVRETFALIPSMKPSGYFTDPKWINRVAWYAADNDKPTWGGKWRPSIHMPRAASRITLELIDVRVERLQDISEDDAIANGAQCPEYPAALTNRGAFGRLWQKINGPDSWDANPWVWALSFRRIESERDA